MKKITPYQKIILFCNYLFLLAIPKAASAATGFKSYFCGTCTDYKDWIQHVWQFAFSFGVVLSTLMLAAAGVMWIASGGDPKRLGIAKKMIIGVISGIALLILSSIIMITIFGPAAWQNGYIGPSS